MIEHTMEVVGVRAMFLDLLGDDGGVWVVQWYIGEISLSSLSHGNNFRGR